MWLILFFNELQTHFITTISNVSISYVQQACRSDHNSMVFEEEQQLYSYVTSRDVNLNFHPIQEDIILEENFDNERLDG